VLVFAMVVVGGATRLTGSGLSITEWKPIMGGPGWRTSTNTSRFRNTPRSTAA
jgi:hypothetical protein